MKYFFCTIILISFASAQTFWERTNAPGNLQINSFYAAGDKIFIATNNGIYRSTDSGNIWEDKSSGLADRHVSSIIKDKNDNLLAGTRAGLFNSTDEGESWVQLNIGLIQTDVRALAVRNDGNVFISAVDSQNTFPSTIYLFSGGDTTEEIYNGIIGDSFVKDFLTDKNDSVFALCIGGIIQYNILYKWDEENREWSQVYQYTSALEIGDLIKNNNDMFFATTNNGLIKSGDRGKTWLPAGLYPNNVLSVIAESDTSLFAGTYYFGTSGLYYSTDNGETWENRNEGMENIPVISFGFDKEGYLYAGTYLQGVYKSSDILTVVKDEYNTKELSFDLKQNYPNPFNGITKIKFTVPIVETHRDASLLTITLKVYDILGNEILTLVNEELPAGSYEIDFVASWLPAGKLGLSSGIYFYQLRAENFSETKKMILMK